MRRVRLLPSSSSPLISQNMWFLCSPSEVCGLYSLSASVFISVFISVHFCLSLSGGHLCVFSLESVAFYFFVFGGLVVSLHIFLMLFQIGAAFVQPCVFVVLSGRQKRDGNDIVIFVQTPYPPLAAAAAAKSVQSCPTLCDPIDGLLPGSSVPGILQARALEWVAISFSSQNSIKLFAFLLLQLFVLCGLF